MDAKTQCPVEWCGSTDVQNSWELPLMDAGSQVQLYNVWICRDCEHSFLKGPLELDPSTQEWATRFYSGAVSCP